MIYYFGKRTAIVSNPLAAGFFFMTVVIYSASRIVFSALAAGIVASSPFQAGGKNGCVVSAPKLFRNPHW